jgi:[NiFe] hydrogenase diaphorase moiety small subunit
MSEHDDTKRPTFVLDGVEVPFVPGQTIMQAAQDAGRYIPHLCHHRDFAPVGSCKVCTVEVGAAGPDAARRAVTSCTYEASPGLVVTSATDELQGERRQLVQMLFVEGNHHCPFCEKSGDCHLQAVAYHLEMKDTHFEHAYPVRPVDASHPDVWLDRNRCILCELCVRASRDHDGKDVFQIGGRGAATTLLVNSQSGLLKDSEIAASDRAVSVCPTGALLPKRAAFLVPIGRRRFDGADIRDRPEDP